MTQADSIHRGRHVRGCRAASWALSAALLAVGSGCEALYPNVLRDAAGQPISFAAIEEILSDSELTEEQQRTALRELGITDDDLINLLISLG